MWYRLYIKYTWGWQGNVPKCFGFVIILIEAFVLWQLCRIYWNGFLYLTYIEFMYLHYISCWEGINGNMKFQRCHRTSRRHVNCGHNISRLYWVIACELLQACGVYNQHYIIYFKSSPVTFLNIGWALICLFLLHIMHVNLWTVILKYLRFSQAANMPITHQQLKCWLKISVLNTGFGGPWARSW